MRMVIVFDAGETGGLLVTDTGARPLQPFERSIRLSLKAAAAMVNAADLELSVTTRGKLAREATNLCNIAVEQVEDVVGQLDQERSLIFQSADGGFICGAGGKPPIALPWPLRPPSVSEAIASGVIDGDAVELLRAARAKQVPLLEVFEDPEQAAERLGVSISTRAAAVLRPLAPSKLGDFSDTVDREIVGMLHRVLEDGRFLDNWHLRPYEVARTLNVQISDEALESLASGGAGASRVEVERISDGGLIAAGVIWAGVCIAIGIVLADAPERTEFIVDRSGVEKL